jgi:hypothetical protein
MLTNKVYDVLKWLAIVALPALATLILTLGNIWGWGNTGDMTAATVTAIATFIGLLCQISTYSVKKDLTGTVTK